MEGTCSECVYPLNEDDIKQICPTDTSLTYAARKGELFCVKELIVAGADVNKGCECHGNGPLLSAAREGHADCLRELLAAEADINKEDNGGRTAFMFAASTGHVECLKELIATGADINKEDNNGQTALWIAASEGHVECLKELIAVGADINKENNGSLTALMIAAAYQDNLECVKELIAAGADINKEDFRGQTALMHAAAPGHVECLKELIVAGAEINKENFLGQTVLMIAAFQGHIECLKELIAVGCEVNKQDEDGNTALMHLVESGNFFCVEEMLKADVDVNVTNEDGNTPLMMAVDFSNVPLVTLLVNKGAEVNLKNNDGKTALYLAVALGHEELHGEQSELHSEHSIYAKIVYTLLQAGAKLNESNAEYNPVTSHLKQTSPVEPNTEILKMLMAAGAELQERILLEFDDSLQGSARKIIRNHLKKLHPERNLYTTISQLGLPHRMKAYMLFNTVHEVERNLTKEETELLHWITQRNGGNVLNLIQAGADVNLQDKQGMTALMAASQDGDVELVAELIEEGANIDVKTYPGDTALIYATKENKINCVQKLIELGANVNIQGEDGETALMHACYIENEPGKFIEALLEGGANPDISSSHGETALLKAIQRRNLDSMDKLIRASATPSIGLYPYLLRDVAVIRKLLEAGVDVNLLFNMATNDDDRATDVLKELIQSGADLNSSDEKGNTLLIRAVSKEYRFITAQERLNRVSTLVSTLIKAGVEVDTTYLAFIAMMISSISSKNSEVVQEQGIVTNLMQMFDGRTDDLDRLLAAVGIPSEDLTDSDERQGSILKALNQEAEKPEILENLLKLFFQTGVTPEFAKNAKDAEVLNNAFRRFGWKYPLKLSTLCKQACSDEMIGMIPLISRCPMTTTRKGRRYLATVAKGEAISLQGDKSDVKLGIKEGCPKRAYLMEVRTDLSSFGPFIPDDECFISPVVEVQVSAETNRSNYVLRIPHCLDEDDDRTKVKVRMIHENRNPAVVEVPKGNAGAFYYDIDARFIELHTTHFCQVMCTICQTPYHCRGRISSFWFAKFDTQERKSSTPEKSSTLLHDVEIRPYFGGVLHTIVDFMESVEATVNLKCVTKGSLKIPRRQFNLESGQIRFSLRVKDRAWQPRLGIEKWDAVERTLAEEKGLLDVIDLDYCHKCREPPFEAAVYSLEAEGEVLEKFRADVNAVLTVEIEESSKEEHSYLALPVDFTKEDVARPSTTGRLKADSPDPVRKTKTSRLSKEEIDSRVEAAGLDELPSEIHDREIAQMAALFSPDTLETVAQQHFDASEAKVKTFKADRRENTEGFKRDLLTYYIDKDHGRKDLYRVLLEAESEGILDDMDMTAVEKLILDPNRDKK